MLCNEIQKLDPHWSCVQIWKITRTSKRLIHKWKTNILDVSEVGLWHFYKDSIIKTITVKDNLLSSYTFLLYHFLLNLFFQKKGVLEYQHNDCSYGWCIWLYITVVYNKLKLLEILYDTSITSSKIHTRYHFFNLIDYNNSVWYKRYQGWLFSGDSTTFCRVVRIHVRILLSVVSIGVWRVLRVIRSCTRNFSIRHYHTRWW